MLNVDTSLISVSGNITFTDKNGDVHEFDIDGMTSIYAACNKIIRTFAVGGCVDDFIKERVIVTSDPKDFVNGMTVYAEFMAWMRKHGHRYEGGRNLLYKEIGMIHGIRRVSGTNRAGFRGMKLLFDDVRLDVDESADDLL